MKLSFELVSQSDSNQLDVDIDTLIIAGWAGRDKDAIEHHIQELEAVGVPRPSAVPLYYRVAANQLTQDEVVQVIGEDSSGEAEVLLFSHQGQALVSLTSDHTDRKLETYSVAHSKQICVKPTARTAWRYDEVADYWDELVLRAWIEEQGQRVLYQEGTLASLQNPLVLAEGHFGKAVPPDGCAMTCGTVSAIGGIRPAVHFAMELYDPRRDRRIEHAYRLDCLPVVA